MKLRSSWSLLSAFGNTPLAKAVVFTPIVAGAVIYSGEYLHNYWGFRDVLWLYWSLIVLSAGQALYLLRAPREIKKHGDNSEAFIDKALNTWSEKAFEAVAIEYVSSFFSQTRGGILKLSALGPLDETFNEKMADFAKPSSGVDQYAGERTLLEKVARRKPIRPTRSVYGVDAERLSAILSALQEVPVNQQQRRSIKVLSKFMNSPSDSTEWKKDALQYTYSYAEESRSVSRHIIASFYVLGSMYFGWHTFMTIIRMAKLTWSNLLVIWS